MKIERKKRPTRLECALYTKEDHDICVEMIAKYKHHLENPSLDDSTISMLNELIEMNEIAIERCNEIFNSSHRTRREEFKKLRRKH